MESTTEPSGNSLYYFSQLYLFLLTFLFSFSFFFTFYNLKYSIFIFRSFSLAKISYKHFMLFSFSFIEMISLCFPLRKKHIYRHFKVSCSISKHWRDLSNIFLFFFNSIWSRHYTFVWFNLPEDYWEVFYTLDHDLFWWLFHVQLMFCVSGLSEMDVP